MSELFGMSGELLLIAEILIVLLIVVAAIWLVRSNRVQKRTAVKTSTPPETPQNLQDFINKQQSENPGQPIKLDLGQSSYTLDEGLKFNSPFHIKGKGQKNTRIISKGNQPAIQIRDAKNCSIEGVHIKGAVQCSNGEVLVENCHIDANDEGVCIEAYDGSVVTFSGTVSSDGGVAIHAKGDSKVILKPPYTVSPDDYVVIDPRSRVSEPDEQ